jgi:hypothetical protein
VSTSRESLRDKVRASPPKTEENGWTEAEELAAPAKVRAMRDTYASLTMNFGSPRR